MPTEIYDTYSPASKKINFYSAEISKVYFQPEDITFIEETLHCIWLAASVHFLSFIIQICNSTIRNILEALEICRENSAVSDKRTWVAQSNTHVLYMCILWGDVNYALALSALYTCIENKIVRHAIPRYNGQHAIIVVWLCSCCSDIILLTVLLFYMWM